MPNSLNQITRTDVDNPERLLRLLREMAAEISGLRAESKPTATTPQPPNVLSGVMNGPAAIVELGIDVIATKKTNLNATVNPTATDDSSKGYDRGSVWINTAAGPPRTIFMLAHAEVTAADWIQIG